MAFGAHIQSKGENAGVVTTKDMAYATNNTAHNILIAIVRVNIGSRVVAVSDSQANTGWQLRKNQYQNDGTQDLNIFVCPDCKAGANTVTFTVSSTAIQCYWIIAEYEGTATAAFDKANGAAPDNSTPWNTGNIVTAYDGELMISGVSNDSSTVYVEDGSGNLLRLQTPSGSTKVALYDRVLGGAGTYAASGEAGENRWMSCAVVSIADVPGGPETTPITVTDLPIDSLAGGEIV